MRCQVVGETPNTKCSRLHSVSSFPRTYLLGLLSYVNTDTAALSYDNLFVDKLLTNYRRPNLQLLSKPLHVESKTGNLLFYLSELTSINCLVRNKTGNSNFRKSCRDRQRYQSTIDNLCSKQNTIKSNIVLF